VNHHQRKVLHAIFAHPLNANLEMKDVVNVLSGLGAEIDAKSKSRLGVTLNGRTMVLHLASHSLLKAEVMQIRKFLESCGITADAYPVWTCPAFVESVFDFTLPALRTEAG
jgi:hypothetical protein